MNRCKETIEWADFTANPFTGCLHGCEYCYARRMANRLRRVKGTVYYWLATRGFNPFCPTFSEEAMHKFLYKCIDRKKPTRIFLGSMSDLGYQGDWLLLHRNGTTTTCGNENLKERVKSLAMRCPHHTFLMLTKNPKGMAGDWPDNCHIGVSADNEMDAFNRILSLMENVRARVRWISLEPILRPVPYRYLRGLDWIVIGAQTGHGAPHLSTRIVDNVDEISKQFKREIPVFVKKNIRDQAAGCWPMQFPD